MVKNGHKKICKISISLADLCIFIQNRTLLPTGISFPKNKSLCSYYLNKVKKQEGNFVIPLFCCTFAVAIVVKLQV